LLGRNPEFPVQITVLESADIGTIGVGEATVPTLKTTLQQLGISEAQLFTDADATLKNGIRFVGWREGGSANTDRYDILLRLRLQSKAIQPFCTGSMRGNMG
jgi:hypothetical protein